MSSVGGNSIAIANAPSHDGRGKNASKLRKNVTSWLVFVEESGKGKDEG